MKSRMDRVWGGASVNRIRAGLYSVLIIPVQLLSSFSGWAYGVIISYLVGLRDDGEQPILPLIAWWTLLTAFLRFGLFHSYWTLQGYYRLPSLSTAPLPVPLWVVSGVTIAIPILYLDWIAHHQAEDLRRSAKLIDDPDTESVGQNLDLLVGDRRIATVRALDALATVCRDGAADVMTNADVDASSVVLKLQHIIEHPRGYSKGTDYQEDEISANAFTALSHFSISHPQSVFDLRYSLFPILKNRGKEGKKIALRIFENIASSISEADEFLLEKADELAKNGNPDERIFACNLLSLIHSTESISRLQTIAQGDSNAGVRNVAQEILESVQATTQTKERKTQRATGGSTNPPHQQSRSMSQDNTKSGPDPEFMESPPDQDFDDVAGMEELKSRLQKNVISPFKDSDVYDKYGVSSDSGILFHGPPGTGKTHIATCLAGELSVNFAKVDVGDIQSKALGEGVENMKQLFEEARRHQPCLVFIDELDAIATDRGTANQHEDSKRIVNQLLQELSDIDTDDDILVIGATNKPDQIDNAILRTGRFDSKIEIPKPDNEARIILFEHYFKQIDAEIESIDGSSLLQVTSGFTASDIEETVSRAARRAANRERESGEEDLVRESDVLEAAEALSREQGTVGEFINTPPDLDFGDVAGMEGLIETLQQKVIDPLENPSLYDEYGVDIEHGILLYGPPGTGKTHISKCLAGELGVNYIHAKASGLVSKYVGEGAKNVEQMFAEARSNEPCLIFIDEIDALAGSRSAQQQTSERQMVNQFLEELSQLNNQHQDVVVITATNTIEDIDDAMLRSGRLTEKIEVPPPDAQARLEILYQHLDAPIDAIEDERVAQLTDGLVASDMETIANQAARMALERARGSERQSGVTTADIVEAITSVRR